MTLAMTLTDWLQCGDAQKLLCVLDTANHTVCWPGDALCLPSADLPWSVIGSGSEAEPVEEFAGVAGDVAAAESGVEGRLNHGVEHATGGVELGVLKHEPELAGAQVCPLGVRH